MIPFGSSLPRRLAPVLLAALAACAGDADDTGKNCAASDLVDQCPAGSNPILDARAQDACSGKANASLITQDGAVSGQCQSEGSCSVLCQFQIPCSCGVERISKTEGVVCAACTQSCGDGRCTGTERPSCAPGALNCAPCAEDCSGPTCGDGDCTGEETPQSCPEDCAAVCEPNATFCVGNVLRRCSASGRESLDVNCAESGLVCSVDRCAAAGVCGNRVCEAGETPSGCAQDCATACSPSARRCEGTTLFTCSADGQMESSTDCATSGLICGAGACQQANVCGNGMCEAGETPDGCRADCATTCEPNVVSCLGNLLRRCSPNGREFTDVDCSAEGLVCSGDQCVPGNLCGNSRCDGQETPQTCPQDCATTCTPNSRRCDGLVLIVCSADGRTETRTECNAQGLICAQNQCRSAGVCGNGSCEAGEDPAGCPQDCGGVCGNRVCEAGEEISCPNDCTVCGNRMCEQGEPQTCPQDCGVCVPSSKTCLGTDLRVCAANGTSFTDVPCALSNQVCGSGECRPPNVCGNGVCETDESNTCAADCAEVCGNGACAGGETFGTCAVDCPPECGDGTCTGFETSQSCAQDCLATCGNGACEGNETRTSCSQDCGYCGDRVCQDGAESPSTNPPAGKQSCPQDCTVLTCQKDEDCDDRIDCTTNRCNAGFCEYPVNHSSCGALSRCLGPATSDASGCCADGDNDGFAAESCGGSDCNDAEPSVKPGAVEFCDGVDRNCSGDNRPALGRPKQLTNDFVIKAGMSSAWNGSTYLLSWVGTPVTTPEVQVARFDNQSNLIGDIETLVGPAPNAYTRAIYSPQYPTDGAFAVAWASPNSARTHVQWIDPVSGDVLRQSPLELGAYTDPGSWIFDWNAGNYIALIASWSWYAVSEAGGVSTLTSPNGHVSYASTPYRDHFATLTTARYLMFVRADNSTAPVIVLPQTSASLTNDSIVAWDGAHAAGAEQGFVVIVSPTATGLQYEKFAPNGLQVFSHNVAALPLKPVQARYVAPRGPGAMGQVAVLAQEGGNLYLLVRNRDGTPALAPGLIAGGQDVKGGQLYFDGNNYVVFYLAQVGNVHQIFSTTVSCR